MEYFSSYELWWNVWNFLHAHIKMKLVDLWTNQLFQDGAKNARNAPEEMIKNSTGDIIKIRSIDRGVNTKLSGKI